MMLVSVGAIASIPIATTSLSSKIGRQLMPLLFDFQIPPAAEATKRVFDGLGMPCTSETRPMKLDGPTFRHRRGETNRRNTGNDSEHTESLHDESLGGWRDEAATIRHYNYEGSNGSVG